jgi:MYXO-CTERM domain-containing protein
MRKAIAIPMLAPALAWAHHPNEAGGWLGAVLDHLSEPDHLLAIAGLAVIGAFWLVRRRRAARPTS